MSMAFIACVESGNLENKARLLFHSIRRYAGKYKDSTLYAFQPRKGLPHTNDTVKDFETLGVTLNNEILNTEFHHYPIGNKIFVCARAEEILTEDILVFLDSDTVIVNEPGDLELSRDSSVAVRPVHSKNRGSTGVEDPNDLYWQKLYALCKVPEAPFIETIVDRKKIRSYWNAGLVAVRRSEGLFHRWKEDFLTLMHAGHIPRGGRLNNMDQLALAATLAKVADRIKILDFRYNYPLPKRPLLTEPYRSAELEDLIHIHYHRWFNKPGFLSMVKPSFNTHSEIYQWLSEFLPFQPTIDDPIPFSDIENKDISIEQNNSR